MISALLLACSTGSIALGKPDLVGDTGTNPVTDTLDSDVDTAGTGTTTEPPPVVIPDWTVGCGSATARRPRWSQGMTNAVEEV